MSGEDQDTTQVRRRPTRRHRRNRLTRRIAAGLVLGFFAIGLSAVALRYLSPSLIHSTANKDVSWQVAQAARDRLRVATENQLRPNSASAHRVYPYSVVPGGVQDARELKWVAEHDPIVAEHYRGFDYDHARVVRLALAQTVFVSYRIGNHVYWTRHRITLRKGEKVITDGKMTARARCANRVEEIPQQLNSVVGPARAKFERPVLPPESTSTAFPPVEFQSALLNRPGINGIEPTPPLSLYNPISGGGGIAIFPPPLPTGVCTPTKKPVKGEISEISDELRKKKKPRPCGNGGGGTTPEPATWLLLITGAVAIGWCVHRKGLSAQP